MRARTGLLTLALLALASCNQASAPIQIIGSSTVYPFTTAVAAAFVEAKKGPAPLVESTGTVAGFEKFCSVQGGADIADASRRMTLAEFRKCQANHVGDLLEIPIGLDGIAIVEADAGPKLTLSRKDLYFALAAFPMGKPNGAKTWKDVNPQLPAIPIQVIGPPASSGTRDVFEQLILQPGCIDANPAARALLSASDPAQLDHACHQIRSDGPYSERGTDYNVIVQHLQQNPDALGVFGYSYLEQNAGKLRAVPVEGVSPDATTIGSGKYPGMRTLYLYVKAAHLTSRPALQDFLNLYATMWEPGGPLTKAGLVAMSESARKRAADTIKRAVPLDEAALL
jgi:phosphate transport system substrate-binding protein